jgi:putative alpha-1,2-mannosidase
VFASIPSSFQTLKDQASSFNQKESTWKPYYFNTSLVGYGTPAADPVLEFTSTDHGAILRLKFPPHFESIDDSGFDQTRRVSIVLDGGDGSEYRGYDAASVRSLSDGGIAIEGYSRANSGGVPNNFHHYYVAAIYAGESVNKGVGRLIGKGEGKEGGYVDLDSLDPINDILTVRIGTSFISLEQAWTNLNHEVRPSVSFNDIYEQSKSEWHELLSKVQITELHDSYSQKQKKDLLTIFYSSLYRASLFPRQISEVLPSGELVHWSPYDPKGGVYPGPLSTDSGFWDAFITVCKFRRLFVIVLLVLLGPLY